MSALIGALRVSLSADTAQFSEGMRRAQTQAATAATGIQKTLGGLKASVAGLAAGLSVGFLLQAGKQALEYAAHLTELGETLGLTAKDLQTFSYAAGQVGVSQEALEQGIQKLTISMGKAQVGSEAQVKAFNAIGISIDQLKGKDTGEVFRLIASKLETVSDRSKRAAVEVALFGKAGAKLDNLLSGAEGKLSELSDAAEKLGIVLSDEQIQKADQTADKLAALGTVLKARIAGEVADNADAILGLANTLGELIGYLDRAGEAWASFMSALTTQYSIPALFNRFAKGEVYGYNTPGQSVTVPLPALGAAPKPKPIGGGSVGSFLAGGGSKHKGAADHSAEDALRDQNQFDQDLRRAQMDTLRAQQDLARDYVERTTIGVEILNAEKAARDAEHDYQIALYKLTKGKQGQSAEQVRQLQLEEDRTDQLARQKLLQDEQEQRQSDIQDLTQHDFDRRRDVLQSMAGLATTAEERRQIELQLLKLAYEQKRQALQAIIDTSKNAKDQEDARRDLENLNATYANDRQGVIQSTRGPLETWAATVPQTAAQVNEALQSIDASALDGLADAITGVIDGTESLKDAFGNLAKSIIADILKMTIRMLIFRAISGIFGGGGLGQSAFPISGGVDPLAPLPGFASGGSMRILGRGGTDRNVLALNGLPIARVSAGERINIANDNVNGGAGGRVIVELQDDMLSAYVADGANIQIARAAPLLRSDAVRSVGERGRRR